MFHGDDWQDTLERQDRAAERADRGSCGVHNGRCLCRPVPHLSLAQPGVVIPFPTNTTASGWTPEAA